MLYPDGMKHITTILAAFAFLNPGCDDPDQADSLSQPVVIDLSADDAEIRTPEGEELMSLAPEELSMVEVDAPVDGLENLSAPAQDPLAWCWACKGCQNNGNGTITCWGCKPLHPGACQEQ